MRRQIPEEENPLAPIVNWHDDPDRACNAVKVCTWDRAGLFCKIAGSLSAAGLQHPQRPDLYPQRRHCPGHVLRQRRPHRQPGGRDNSERFQDVIDKALTGEEVDFQALIARQQITRPAYQALHRRAHPHPRALR